METLIRDWGEELIFANTPTYMGKLLRRRAGTHGDLQFHLKSETHYLLEGRLIVRIALPTAPTQDELTDTIMQPGMAWHVPAGTLHQEEAITNCVEVEASEPTLHDRVRIETMTGVPVTGGLPSTSVLEALRILRTLATAYRHRARECEAQMHRIETHQRVVP